MVSNSAVGTTTSSTAKPRARAAWASSASRGAEARAGHAEEGELPRRLPQPARDDVSGGGRHLRGEASGSASMEQLRQPRGRLRLAVIHRCRGSSAPTSTYVRPAPRDAKARQTRTSSAFCA